MALPLCAEPQHSIQTYPDPVLLTLVSDIPSQRRAGHSSRQTTCQREYCRHSYAPLSSQVIVLRPHLAGRRRQALRSVTPSFRYCMSSARYGNPSRRDRPPRPQHAEIPSSGARQAIAETCKNIRPVLTEHLRHAPAVDRFVTHSRRAAGSRHPLCLKLTGRSWFGFS